MAPAPDNVVEPANTANEVGGSPLASSSSTSAPPVAIASSRAPRTFCEFAQPFPIVPKFAHGQSTSNEPSPRHVLRACVDLVLYEGLPHGLFERDLCESELRTKSTVRRHGELIYAAPIPITAADADALRATFGEAGNYFARDATGMSLCGGFHADYELTWTSSAGEYELHVCFGCYEANLYSPAGLVPFGMRGTHYRPSPPRDTLHPFRVQRPAREW